MGAIATPGIVQARYNGGGNIKESGGEGGGNK